MKIKCKRLFILTLMIVFLFYKTDSVVAMANEEPEQSMESAAEPEAEQSMESAAEPEAEQSMESAAEPESEQNVESAAEPESEQNVESAVEPEAEQNAESIAEAESEQNVESAAEPESEQDKESTGEVESEQSVESVAGADVKQNTEPAAESESEQNMETTSPLNYTQDLVSSGTALLEWLEAHKDIGGMVKLADDVVLDEDYCYCPNGMNRPGVFVDADGYTITITAEIELMSDKNLTISGQPDGKSIFYVAPKGMLSMMGIAVESGKCALWQEEGAGLVIDDDCHISGSIHYADTPFILDQDPVCVVVEKGQTLDDVLPAQIICTVNRQGKVSHNESVPLSWNLEGTEKQQAKRLRFRIGGSFPYATAEVPRCTVVYNDYPLTFTHVQAADNGRWYLFRGGYTKPEEYLPITVISEYSFDSENWIVYEEESVKDVNAGFFIAFPSNQSNRAANPNIYIRLHCNHNGTGYYSNVLCYAADNLECVEDIGGSRGGGTSITNPPDDPQGSDDTAAAGNGSADDHAEEDTGSGSVESKAPSDTKQSESGSGDSGLAAANDGLLLNAGLPLYAESKAGNVGQAAEAEHKAGNADRLAEAEQKTGNAGRSAEAETKSESGLRETNTLSGRLSKTNEQMPRADIRESKVIFIATGFVLLSAVAGIVGFCVHSRSGTNR